MISLRVCENTTVDVSWKLGTQTNYACEIVDAAHSYVEQSIVSRVKVRATRVEDGSVPVQEGWLLIQAGLNNEVAFGTEVV